eukprot:5900942-Pyramimonas_sp.AAC.1
MCQTIFCGCLTTGQALVKWGYQFDGLCPYCQQLDTPYHRIWLCPHAEEVRQEFLADLIEPARAA